MDRQLGEIANHNLISCAIVDLGVVHTILRLLLAQAEQEDRRETWHLAEIGRAADTILNLCRAAYELGTGDLGASYAEIERRINQRLAEIYRCAAARTVRPHDAYHQVLYHCEGDGGLS